MSREGRSQPVQPYSSHGFVDPGPGPVGTVPPRVVVVPIAPRPRQYHVPPCDPISISGAYLPTAPPTILPPTPQAVEPDDTRRLRRRNPDPISLSGLLASLVSAPPAIPPGPFVVPLDERRRFLAALPPVSVSGALASFVVVLFVAPPAPQTVEPDDKRKLRRTPDALALSGVLAPVVIGPTTAPQRMLVGVGV